MADDGLCQRLADARNEAEQGPAGGVEIDADKVDAGLDHLIEGLFQSRLADVVLILAYADTLGVDLDQLGQRVLQAAGDGDGAAHRQIEIGELLAGDIRGRIDTGPGFADHDYLRFEARFFQSLTDELVHLPAGGAVADGHHLDVVVFNQAQQLTPGTLNFAATSSMGIDGDMLDKLAGGIDGRQLGAGAQAGVDAQHPMAASGRSEEQVAQVLGKDPNRFVIGGGFCLQA